MSFYKNKRVFVTGHTGFKGSWLVTILKMKGAIVTGYSLQPPTNPSLFESANVSEGMTSIIGDIRDYESLKKAFDQAQPEIVLHLAAQPIVRDSYRIPKDTYDINVMGTVNILECVRLSSTVKSFLNVTTDKVYENKEMGIAFTEDMPLDGYDPYSNSKSCSELVTHSYKSSFFSDGKVAISTARAGNVIGGGDFAMDRIIPDCVRAVLSNSQLKLRNPNSIRPYQHVLEPLFAYLEICKKQYEDGAFAGYYNVGPLERDCLKTGELVDCFDKAWGGLSYVYENDNGPHEANFLKLDCKKIRDVLGVNPCWTAQTAVEKVVEWSKVYKDKGDLTKVMIDQINEYEKLFK